jgi:DNA-binding transcriptional LysR family regulator
MQVQGDERHDAPESQRIGVATPNVRADDLILLLTLARTGRMVTSGEILRLDHTTVSRRIRRLERELGLTLIARGANGWEITELGLAVAHAAHPLETVLRDVHAIAAGGPDGLRGVVRIAAPDGFGATFVPATAARLRHDHPQIRIELVTSTRPTTLREAGHDLTISVGRPSTKRLISQPLTEYSLRLYQSAAYAAQHAPIRSAEDLHAHTLIFYVESLLSVAELDLARNFSDLIVGFASTSVAAQVEATRRGVGIGLLPSFLAGPLEDLAPVLADEVSFELSYWLSMRQEGADNEAVAAVRDALLAEVRQRRDDGAL